MPSDFYRRNLPHWHPEGHTFFITFRLAHTLPVAVIRQLEQEREAEQKALQRDELYNLDKKYFGRFDAWLDRCVEESPRWLAEERIARIVAHSLHAYDGIRYRLLAYCIMPNHVHLLIDTSPHASTPNHRGPTCAYPLADTLKRLKGRTARYGNQALGREGPFWHHESYDHVVRDEKEFERIVWYIMNNPVKAGLAERWEDWPWTYVG